ncbi:DUF5906 domain-containing protein [Vannielia litorea]|uniref:DUF5906 domain-containing protein n=1 Tax=Vannielia litorea TaxID=1217970 RepID=UPI001BCFDF28|nr:DUF5906 domain-containing protein [Vannielia litorea]MBS8225737.1 hypothetical protein [Vannielia litorea]
MNVVATGDEPSELTGEDTLSVTSASQEWLEQGLLRVAKGDPIYDATALNALKSDGQKRGLKLEISQLKRRIAELRSAANDAEHIQGGKTEYEALITRLNEEFFVYEGGDKVYIGSWRKQGTRRALVQRTQQDFRLLLANEPKVFSPIADKAIPAAEAWLSDPQRRSVKGFVFEADPKNAAGLEREGRENLFEGFSVEPEPGSIEPFLKHLEEVVVSNEAEHRREDLTQYLLDCFAHIVQRPGVPLRVALVFRGRQGSGKSFMTDTLGSLFKGNVFETSQAEDIVGRFTGHLLNACLVVGDEALFAGSRKDADAIKRLITQDTLRVEAKYRDVQNEKNRITLMLTSNHAHAVHIEPSDRRFFVLDVADSRTPRNEHEEYWEQLWGWAQSEEGKAALLDHLLNRDISSFDAQRDRPQTQARLDQILASLDPVGRWFHEELVQRATPPHEILHGSVRDGEISAETADGLPPDSRVIRKEALFEAYATWEQETLRSARSLNHRMFWKKFWDILDQSLETRIRLKGHPTRVVYLPPLKVRASCFLNAIGCAELGIELLDLPDEEEAPRNRAVCAPSESRHKTLPLTQV